MRSPAHTAAGPGFARRAAEAGLRAAVGGRDEPLADHGRAGIGPASDD